MDFGQQVTTVVMEAAPILHLSSDSYPGRSDLSHSVSTAVSAEAELQADDLGDDSDGTEIAGDSSNGSRAAVLSIPHEPRVAFELRKLYGNLAHHVSSKRS